MPDHSRLIMKRYNLKIALISFLAISISCLVYLNEVESTQAQSQTTYEEVSYSADKMVSGFKSARVIATKVINFLTQRDVGWSTD